MKLVNARIFQVLSDRRKGDYDGKQFTILDIFEQRAKKDGITLDDTVLRDIVGFVLFVFRQLLTVPQTIFVVVVFQLNTIAEF
jgi:hypothetical protein